MGGVGGYRRSMRLPKPDSNTPAEAKDLRYRQGITAGLMIDATSIDLPASAAGTPGDRALADMKPLAPGANCPESTSAAFSHSIKKR